MINYDVLASIRKEKGITWSYLESCINAYRGKFVDLKKGKTSLTEEEEKKIAEALGVTVEYLRTGKKQENIRVYDEDDNIVALDDETLEVIDSLRKRPEMKILFSVSKKATKEDIIKAVKIIEALRDTKEGD